jgi:DNA-binding GntR family transcriptional regulator
MRSTFIGTSKEPRYVQVCKALLRAISTGEYLVGSLLPHEAALCEKYGVSRTTVREALRQLSEHGVVDKLHGIGTIVKNAEPRSNYVIAVNATDLMQYGKETTLTMLDRTEITTEAAHVRLFGCDLGESWIHIRGLRSPIDDAEHPISLVEVYVPSRFASVAQEDMVADRPYHKRIADRYQIPIVDIDQEIQAVSIDTDIAHYLRVKAHTPGLYIIRRYFGSDNKLIQASLNTHPSERFSYRFYLNQVVLSK